MWEFNVDVKEKLSTFSAGNETDSEAQKIQAKRDFGRSIHRPSPCLGEKKKTAWGSGYEHKLKCQIQFSSVSSVAQPCPTLCDPMNHGTPGLPVHHQLLESTQTHVHWVGDAIQPSHPLSSPSPPALNLSQHQDLFKCVSSLHQVAKVLEFQLQQQSFQWTPRTDLL